MSRFLVLSPGIPLVSEVVKLLSGSGRDYSHDLVLFQGKRPGHFLRKELARKCGGALLPPHITTRDGLIDDLFARSLVSARPDLSGLDAVALLFEMCREGRTFPGSEHFERLERFFPVGLEIFRALEEVRRALVTSSQLAAVDSPLRDFYDPFYERVEEMHRSTPASRYAAVIRADDWRRLSDFETVVVAGFFGLADTDKVLAKKLRALENVTFLFQEGPGMQEQLRALGFPARPVREEQRDARVHFYSATSLEEEVLAAARILDEKTNFNAGEETVIVLPSSEALFPVYQWIVPLLGSGPYNISLAYPLERTPIFGFLDALSQLASSLEGNEVPTSGYLQFMLHPYTKNIRWKGHADATRIVMNTIEDFCTKHGTRRYVDVQELEQNAEIRTHAVRRLAGAGFEASEDEVGEHLKGIHQSTIRALAGGATIGDYAARLVRVLLFIRDESTAPLHPYFGKFLEETCGALEEIKRSTMAGWKLWGPTSFPSIFRRVLQSASIPFPGTPLSGLQILGFLETRNLHFTRVFLLDANEGILPPAESPDPFLPPDVRKQLGIPGGEARVAAAEHSFSVLVNAASEVHCFYREREGESRSRFVEQLLWRRQKKEHVATDEQMVQPVRRRLTLSQRRPEPLHKPAGYAETISQFVFSATALDTYLRCPLQFFYGRILRLNEREETSPTIDRRDIGTLIHLTLREWAKPSVGRALTDDDVDPARIEKVFEESSLSMFGRDASPDLFLMKESAKTQLRNIMRGYFGPNIGGPVLLGVEVRLQGEMFGVSFRGIADRIERRGEQVHILDFKIGRDPARHTIRFDTLDLTRRESWGKSIGSVQLPLYRFLHANEKSLSPGLIIPAYVMLGRSTIDSSIESAMFDEPALAGQESDAARQVLQTLVDEIRDPRRPFTPPENLQEHCPECAFTGICGTSWVRSKTPES
jgi:ATP-dependent helicase/nuclease subunit B